MSISKIVIGISYRRVWNSPQSSSGEEFSAICHHTTCGCEDDERYRYSHTGLPKMHMSFSLVFLAIDNTIVCIM